MPVPYSFPFKTASPFKQKLILYCRALSAPSAHFYRFSIRFLSANRTVIKKREKVRLCQLEPFINKISAKPIVTKFQPFSLYFCCNNEKRNSRFLTNHGKTVVFRTIRGKFKKTNKNE